ncbi:unnamed protein product [Diabrotica balteata]|uniref:Uncharacterized protein n=1 Tax=Diabrotica balteata TaxID=107213 RepID=A0A9N9XBY3_DIABA|nr:unnamed protein product [Diabrotica balteata]
MCKLGAWNDRSNEEKEKELLSEFKTIKLDILAILESKNNEQGVVKLDNSRIQIYSRVKMKKRAPARRTVNRYMKNKLYK